MAPAESSGVTCGPPAAPRTPTARSPGEHQPSRRGEGAPALDRWGQGRPAPYRASSAARPGLRIHRDHGRDADSEWFSMIEKGLLLSAVVNPSGSWNRRSGAEGYGKEGAKAA